MAKKKSAAVNAEDFSFEYQGNLYELNTDLVPEGSFKITGIPAEHTRQSLLVDDSTHEHLIKLGIASLKEEHIVPPAGDEAAPSA